MSPHLPHGIAAWTIAAYYLLALPVGLAVHWWRNRVHPPTGVLPLVEGRRVSTLPPRSGVRSMFDPGKGTRP